MTYRILSVCGALGYGFDENSLNEAMKTKLELIAADAGSMDAGPYYLGKGLSYFARAALKRDFTLMLRAALDQKCPLILGSCGMAGDDPNLNYMLDIAKEVFEELSVKNIKVAVVSSHIEPSLLIGEVDQLTPLGKMPPLTTEDLTQSKIVGQMGIAPFIKALDEGAQVIFCGRACDVAIFAAPAIRHGIDPGLAYHAGHILECGALACDPGSASDVLAAEFAGETVTFIAFNKMRKVTPKSIAAHSLYEESHPCLQFYPEGVLVMEHTQYEAKTPTIAGIKKSLFVYSPLTLKLEGSRKIGERYISLLFCKPDNAIPESFLLYGRNGVETYPVTDQEQEIGILIKVTSKSETSAETLASLLKGYMLHYGYPNRRTTAGNIAFPISPSAINFRNNDGLCTSLVIAGTREPLFIQQYAQIKNSVIELAKNNFPEIFKQCEVEILTADAKNPLLFIDTIEKTKEEAQKKHKEVLKTIQQWVDKERMPYSCIFGGEVYRWSIYHLLKNQKIIKKLFPIKLYHADGKKWTLLKEVSADYQAIGIPKNKYQGSINPKEVNQIKKITHKGKPVGYKPLLEMATVIRTKDAGINTITYDIFFTSLHDYRAALKSNAFSKESIAKILGVPKSLIIGTFQVDTCNAIKISRYREKISGTSGSRDVFGSQQQLKIEQMVIPLMV